MNLNSTLRIQSTSQPDIKLDPVDWKLYLIVRNINKVRTVRRLNDQLNQVLQQKITH